MRDPHRLSLTTRVLMGFLVLLGAVAPLVAHQEDPKTAYRAQPYTGPGYQSGLPQPSTAFAGGGAQPLGGGAGFDSLGVTLLSWVTLPELGPSISSGNDCWGYTSPSGREYALIGHSAGTTVVEITDPGLPVVLTMIGGPTSLWRDVKTYSNYAYSVSEGGGGIQVIDLSDVDNGVVTLATTILGPGGSTEASHNVVIDEDSGFLYRCGGGSNGLRIYSLANPAAPVFVGSWSDRYIHDAQVVTYTTGPYAGSQIAFVCSGLNGGFLNTGLDILDVTNKANIISLSQVIYPNGQYSHQAWLSPDRQFLYLNDELDEGNLGLPTKTFVFDVSDLANPILSGDFTNGIAAIGHNLYTDENLIFEANYRSGMRIFDASNPLAPIEVAYFDTYPDDDLAEFNGLWSLYPYFPSGTVIGSDLERGLFVWQVGDPALEITFPTGQPTLLDPAGGDVVEVEIQPATGFTLDVTTPTLWVDAGSGFVSSPLVSINATLFEGTFPATMCGESVRWYVSAAPIGESEVRSPPAAPGTFYVVESRLGESLLTADPMETDLGWTVGDVTDTATTGIWERVDPNGTGAQPEDDHTTGLGTDCWITGQSAVGASLGVNDIDGGATTLLSPGYDLSLSTFPVISYWRWFSNSSGGNPFEDVLEVSISPDGGSSWFPVETVGPTGVEVNGGWFEHTFDPADLIPLTSNVRLRFVASDLGAGSVVEAAIDDLRIDEVVCIDCNQNGSDDAADIALGSSLDSNLDGIPDECQPPPCPIPFVRGDANADGSVDLSDAIGILTYLFSGGGMPDPIDRADIDAGGTVNITDAINLLAYMFAGGLPPEAPFPDPGCP